MILIKDLQISRFANKFPNFPGFPDGNPSMDVRTARGAAPLIVVFTLQKGRARVQCIE